jgi:hypothetical protein
VASKSYTQILPNIYIPITKNITLARLLYDFIYFIAKKEKERKEKLGNHVEATLLLVPLRQKFMWES